MLRKLCLVLCGLLTVSSINICAAQAVSVKLNGELVAFQDASPMVKEGRTLIPLRGLFENMGYEIGWEPNTKAAVLTKEGSTISIRSEKKYITINNIQKQIDVPAQIINGRMMIPLRAVADATGADISWDATAKTADITTNADKEYFIVFDGYAKSYIEVIQPLSYLDDVAAQLNTLNSDGSRDNIKKTQDMLEQGREVIISVINDVEDLEPGEKFAEHQKLALECLNTDLELIDVLQKSFLNGSEYAHINMRVSEILTKAKEINAQLAKLSL